MNPARLKRLGIPEGKLRAVTSAAGPVARFDPVMVRMASPGERAQDWQQMEMTTDRVWLS